MAHTWGPHRIVHVDREGDRDRASDGYSRYGAYVSARKHQFVDTYEGPEAPLEPIRFALEAWRIATPPVMGPGLVDWRPDLHKVTIGYDEDGADMMVTVELPLRHNQLAAEIPYSYKDWELQRHWGADDYQYLLEPGTRRDRPTVITTVTIRHILTSVTLVTPGRPTGRQLVDDALRSVNLTAAAINAELPEIIRTVQGADT